MSMNQLQPELIKVLSMDKENQTRIINRLDRISTDFGRLNVTRWRNSLNDKKNTLMHELVERDLPDVVDYVVKNYDFDINIRRESDGSTPFQLAFDNQNSAMCNLLKGLGADETLDDGIKWPPEKYQEYAMNIVWLDLEMTSLENPEILECAVIITDKNLKKLAKKNWIIHFEQSELDKLGPWHQDTFKDRSQGGNGLFADVLESEFTKEQVEQELLNLLKQYCPRKKCSLGGSSIHIDREVLKLRMTKVHDYLHYRIIDVSSFQAVMRRWAPEIEKEIKKQQAPNGQEDVKHRAMDDIKWSISFMKLFRPFLDNQSDVNDKNSKPSMHNRRRINSVSRDARAIKRSEIDQNKKSFGSYAKERRLPERSKLDNEFDRRASNTDQQIYDANPHLRGVFKNNDRIEFYEKSFTNDNRFLKLSSKRMENNRYDSTKHSTTEHWEQRKLLLTEIDFLTNYGADEDYQVIYAGAAPGSYLTYLSSLFPRLKFVLIDTKKFSIVQSNQIKIRSEKFTDDLANHYSDPKYKILFICNVHTADNIPNTIMHDMSNQRQWHELMKPRASLLNFRLPYESGKTQYLKGELMIEPWAAKRPIECRLIVKKDSKLIDYDNINFAENMAYFNNVKRMRYYEYDTNDINIKGRDHCYDCRAEIFIIQQYLKKVQKITNEAILKTKTAEMSYNISNTYKEQKLIIDINQGMNVIPKK